MRDSSKIELLRRHTPGPRAIYFLPVHWDPGKYYVHIPFTAYTQILAAMQHGGFTVYQFRGIEGAPLEDVRFSLANYLEGEKRDAGPSRRKDFFLAGIATLAAGVFFMMGIFDVIIPDPVPFVDEAFSFLASFLSYQFGASRWKRITEGKQIMDSLEIKIRGLTAAEDPVLTRIYVSICEFHRSGKILDDLDDVHVISDHMENSMSKVNISPREIKEMIDSGDAFEKVVVGMTAQIARVFRLDELCDKDFKENDRQRQKIIDEIKSRTQITDAALFVYQYFYRSAQQLFGSELSDELAAVLDV